MFGRKVICTHYLSLKDRFVLFQETLPTIEEDALFAIYLYNKNFDTREQR